MEKLNSVAEREAFLEKHIAKGGAYFVVTHGEVTELLWFTQFKNWKKDGSDWYLEYPCYMRRVKTTHPEDDAYYTGIGFVLKEDGYAYEVDSPQVSPFLPETVGMAHLGDSEEVAVDWLLANTYVDHQWRN